MPQEKYVFVCNKCKRTAVKNFDEIKICGWCTYCRKVGRFTHLSCTWKRIIDDELDAVEVNASWSHWEIRDLNSGCNHSFSMGKWVRYDKFLNDFFERSFNHGITCVTFVNHGNKYSASLQKMMQYPSNVEDPASEKPIRRDEIKPKLGGNLRPPLSSYVNNHNWICPPRVFFSKEKRISVYEIKSEDLRTLRPSSFSRDRLEYEFASSHFTRLLDGESSGECVVPREVVQVDCIIYEHCAPVLQQYETLKNRFLALGKAVKVILVFHGTDSDAIQQIIGGGFKVGGSRGVPVKNGTTYGRGVYTSTGPEAAIQFGKGSGKVILAKALTGDCTAAYPRYSSGSPGRLHDSWSPAEQEDWIVFKDGNQLIPLYVIHFQEKYA